MFSRRMALATLVALLVVLFAPHGSPQPQQVAAQAAAIPRRLLDDTIVSLWTVATPRLLWLTYPRCDGSPTAAGAPVTLSRLPSDGSPARVLYSNNPPRAPGVCNPYRINSNIVADTQFIYWVDARGLARLSTQANPGDEPTILHPYPADRSYSLAIGPEHVFILAATEVFGLEYVLIETVLKASGARIAAQTEPATSPRSMQTDGEYIYYLRDTVTEVGELRRANIGGGGFTRIGANIRQFHPAGLREFCRIENFQQICTRTSFVFLISENQRRLERYDNVSGERKIIAIPQYPNLSVQLYGLTTAQFGALDYLFFVEKRIEPCNGCFVTPSVDLIMRMDFNGGNAAPLYTWESNTAVNLGGLRTDNTNIYWRETSTNATPPPNLFSPVDLYSLPVNAAALPVTNLTITGMEVNQGVQRSDNGVPLIKDRRTFVRVFARSAGPAVPNVRALLYASGPGIAGGPLSAIATVQPNPRRDALEQSFVFELPWDWTLADTLTLRAVLNPYRIQQEDTYNDNTLQRGPFSLRESAKLTVDMVSLRYTLNGTTYRATKLYDIGQASSLVRRMFPLASTPGFEGNDPQRDPTARGFRPRISEITDEGIGVRIDYTVAPEDTPDVCRYLLEVNDDGTVKTDNRNQCATDYVKGQLFELRKRLGRTEADFYYGFIPSPAGQEPRGSASSGVNVAAGAAASAYTAAHEIAHVLQRNHPFKGSALETDPALRVCGNTLADGEIDNSYPYEGSRIGPGNGAVIGLDVGTPLAYIPAPGDPAAPRPVLYSDDNSHDIIGYCTANWWISDYTYRCMIEFLDTRKKSQACGGPAPAAQVEALAPPQLQQGAWLELTGALGPGGQAAQILTVRRFSGAASPTPPGAGYRLHMLDATGALLAEHPFGVPSGHHGGSAFFNLTVPNVSGLAELRIVREGAAPASSTDPFLCDVGLSADGSAQALLARRPVSAAAPTVSAVALRNPPDPISGPVTLAWQGRDPDGDTLRYDVLISYDAGTSFAPLLLNHAGSAAQIDTAELGGGTAIFRVIASDGANEALADSPPYSLPYKAPETTILYPADGARFAWGDTVNFSGEAFDPQDGAVGAENYFWTYNGVFFGDGPQVSFAGFPVGTHTITLMTQNDYGEEGTASITIHIGDELAEPPPQLAAAPELVAWSVAPGATTTLTAQVELQNVGAAGGISWAASSDAAWLQVTPADGTTPAVITLTADPRDLAEGEVYRATVTLTATVGDESIATRSIPVTLTIGNTVTPPRAPPTGSAFQRVYLPLMRR